MVITQQKYAISAKIWQVSEMSWFSKKYAVSAKTGCVIKMPDDDTTKDSWVSKNLLYQQKFWQVSEMSWYSKKYAVSAKTCWVIKMPDDDSTKDSWVSKNLLSQQKISWFSKLSCVHVPLVDVGRDVAVWRWLRLRRDTQSHRRVTCQDVTTKVICSSAVSDCLPGGHAGQGLSR